MRARALLTFLLPSSTAPAAYWPRDSVTRPGTLRHVAPTRERRHRAASDAPRRLDSVVYHEAQAERAWIRLLALFETALA